MTDFTIEGNNIRVGGKTEPKKNDPCTGTEPKKNDPCTGIELIRDENGIFLYRLRLVFREKRVPQTVTLTWREPNGDAYSVFTPINNADRSLHPSWMRVSRAESCADSGMPLYQFNDKAGRNICTAALSDCFVPCRLTGGIEERSGLCLFRLELFTETAAPLSYYETELRVDRTRRPFYEVLRDVRAYWTECGYVSCAAPEEARACMYSSWYAFQKDVDAPRLLRQCELAREYGMETVILDDGWQTPFCGGGDQREALRDAGDWENYRPKFNSIAAFADRLHAMGMKLILWIGTPNIGRQAKDYARLRDMLLYPVVGEDGSSVADPRFAAVRRWYTEKLTNLYRDYHLDGFKLDYIDSFRLRDGQPPRPGMDIPDLQQAVDRLLCEITTALRAVDSRVMIEFRQPYAGPVMQRYGNLLRVTDRAYGSLFNRVNGIDLRLLSDRAAVHSDMLLWDYSASVEAAADQLTALLFIVPQISVLLDRLPPDHRKMLRFYLSFLNANRDILQKGRLVPLYPEALYAAVYAEKDGRVICALYAQNACVLPENTRAWTVVNATGSDTVLISGSGWEQRAYTVYSCTGETVETGRITAQTMRFTVPHNGMIVIP